MYALIHFINLFPNNFPKLFIPVVCVLFFFCCFGFIFRIYRNEPETKGWCSQPLLHIILKTESKVAYRNDNNDVGWLWAWRLGMPASRADGGWQEKSQTMNGLGFIFRGGLNKFRRFGKQHNHQPSHQHQVDFVPPPPKRLRHPLSLKKNSYYCKARTRAQRIRQKAREHRHD